MTAVLLSLLAAAAYGLGDFVGGVTSKKASPWAVALVVQLSGGVLVLALAVASDGSPTSTDLAWAVAAGVGNGFGTAFLYRGLASGRMGVVAPVSGVGAAVVPVVVGLLTGERPSALVWVGIAAALPGIWLVSRQPGADLPDRPLEPAPGTGAVDGVLAGLGFGSLFAALAQIREEAGFLPLALNQLVAGGVVVAVAVILREGWVPGRGAALGVVPGALGALATGAFMVASQGGYLTVTAVLTSLYPAFTVVLAATLLRERVHRGQGVGLLLCAVAVALVAGGGAGSAVATTEPSVRLPAPSTPQPPSGPTASSSSSPGDDAILVAHREAGLSEVTSRRAEAIRAGRTRWRVVGDVEQVARDRRAVAFVPLTDVRPWVRAVTVDGRDPLAGTASVRLVGDIMLGRGVAAVSPPGDPVWTLRSARRLLSGADLTIGNLESTLSAAGTPRQPGDDSFAADPAVLDGLASLGVDALSLANNHTGDFGDVALRRTLAAVRRSPVAGFGAGRDLAEASRAAVLPAGGLRVGVVGFNAIGETPAATPDSPGALSLTMPPRTGPLDRAALRHLLGVVRRLERRVDAVVVVPHWGANYTHVADPAQRYVARRLAAAGADLVAGGHPHWVQGVERAGEAVVAHSLGNLVFDMDFMAETMEGAALTARFAETHLVAVELTPYRLDGSFRPHVLRGARADGVLADVRRHSRGVVSAP